MKERWCNADQLEADAFCSSNAIPHSAKYTSAFKAMQLLRNVFEQLVIMRENLGLSIHATNATEYTSSQFELE